MTTIRLADLLDRDAVADLAGPAFFDRGVGYVDEGRVGSITESDEAIEATVLGENLYTVRVFAVGEAIDADCSCPMGQSDAFCKHCVALSLAWLGDRAADTEADAEVPAGVEPTVNAGADPVGAFLAGLDRDALEQLIRDEMARDEELATRLRLRAAVAVPDGVDLSDLRKVFDRATRPPRTLRYRDVPAYVSEVHEAAGALELLIREGRADAVIALAERALHRLERVLEGADDSDGLIGDLLVRLQRIHLEACRAARPEPVELAQRLFRWELEGDWDVFRGAAKTYADVLGQTGLATYRELAQAEWAAVPALGPGDEEEAAEHVDRFSVTYMIESLARAHGDVDMEIATMSRDLSSAYAFLRIARVCQQAGRDDEALDWAERGVQSFPDRTHIDLREFLADAYLARSRDDDAMALIWAELCARPSLGAYQRLKGYADRIRAWDTWRPRAMKQVRRTIASEMAAAPSPAQPTPWRNRHAWQQSPDGSLLVDILLWEGDLEAAWDEAHELGCRRTTWLNLANRGEETRPEDAVAVYRREVEALHAVTDKRVYAQVIDLLGRIGRLMSGLDRSREFAVYAADVRASNARRPAFLALFDAAGFPEPGPALRLVKGTLDP